jgi:L-ascorbate metabolism protein UlaG (beta-lactamase superfamily)
LTTLLSFNPYQFMKFTFFGHACFMIETMGKVLLFDPYITPNELAEGVNVGIIKPDYIVLSHGHEDHVADVELIYKNSNATIISNFEVINWFGNKGFNRAHPMNPGGKWQFDFGTLKMVNAIHSSSMPDGSYGGVPVGIIISNKEGAFYYAGDTALTKDMELIGEEFDLNFAIMPIGDNFTMGIDDALKACKMVKTDKLIGVHFDTFPYVKIDHESAKRAASDNSITLFLPEIEQEISL